MVTSENERAVGSRALFAKVLVPIDFSSAARAAFIMAMKMAREWGSEVILFNAPGPDGNDEFLDYTGVSWNTADVKREARGSLERFADTVVPGSASQVRISVERADDPVAAIEHACRTHEPSLIVLGTHHRDKHKVFRSRAEKVARTVPCPVMFVRGEREVRVDAD